MLGVELELLADGGLYSLELEFLLVKQFGLPLQPRRFLLELAVLLLQLVNLRGEILQLLLL